MQLILVPYSPKRIANQILIIAKLHRRKGFTLKGSVSSIIRPSRFATEEEE